MKPVHSMTGFGTAEGKISGQRFRVEMKSVNHRFLDLKVRLPREFQSVEIQARKSIEAVFHRGAIEIKVDRIAEPGSAPQAPEIQVELAAHYLRSLQKLQKELGLEDPIRTADLVALPEVLSRGEQAPLVEDAWTELQPLLQAGAIQLQQMRKTEGEALARELRQALTALGATLGEIRGKRATWQESAAQKLREKIEGVFETFPLPAGSSIQSILESRISQELALLLDRTDIEEELVRFQGHLDHFAQILGEGGPIGRKLDFLIQELGREVNTLSNKAQDHGISSEAIRIKVRLEQIREQAMNLE